MFDRFWQDTRFALRTMLRSRGIFAVAVLSLALGIAANTTIFSAVDVFLFRPFGFDDPDRLVHVWGTDRERGWFSLGLSIPDFLDYRAESRTLDVAAYTGASFNLEGREQSERIEGQLVSANLFRVLGVQPALGRGFLPEDEASGNHRVALVSDALWQRRFGGDAAAVGRTLTLDGHTYAVVGVMPADFRFPSNTVELWMPLHYDGGESRARTNLLSIARIRPGYGLEQAEAELRQVAARLAAAFPASNAARSVRLLALQQQLCGDTCRRAIGIVSAAVTFVLLIACANVANLLLARAAAREREIAVRAALGAGRLRLARQFMTESVVLALCGGAIGVLLSLWGVQALVGIIPPSLPGIERIAVNDRVLAFTLAVSVASGLLFGLAPALQASRPELRESLKEGSRGATVGSRRGRLRGTLVAAEIGLALVLLVAASLLVRSFIGLQHVDPGFNAERVLTFRVTLPESRYAGDEDVIEFHRRLVERMAALPAVESAGATTILPVSGNSSTTYTIEADPPPPEGREPVVSFRGVSPGYFRTLGIPVLRGRSFTEQDRAGGPPVILVNESFARRHWPDGDPLEQRVVFSSGPHEIVGVVRDTREWGPGSEPYAMVYFSAGQRPYRSLGLALRTAGDPASLTAIARRELAGLDPDLPLYRVMTLEALLATANEENATLATLLGLFGLIALALAVVGVYGVMAYSVAQRTQEMGIRMALGAHAGSIRLLVLRQGLTLAALGIAGGLLLAFGVTRLLSRFLYGVGPFDALTFAAVPAALLAAALAACYIPARRATRVDPVIALRYE